MIIQTIDTVSAFRDEFHRMGRGKQFTYDGLASLFEWLEEVYSGETYELDVVALCCDFAEYTPDELIKEFGVTAETMELSEILEFLHDRATVIDVSNGNYILQGF